MYRDAEMRNYRPVLLKRLDIRLPGIHIRRLRLHRHLPETDTVADHRHLFSQVVCYVSGRGVVRVNGLQQEVHHGSVVFFPPRCVHGFREPLVRRPVTLAIDFAMRGSNHRDFQIGRLSQESLAKLKRELSDLARMGDASCGTARVASAAIALRAFDLCLRALGWFASKEHPFSPHVSIFERLLAQPDALEVPVGLLAKRAGFHRDYLSRKLREATGLTLRERRDAARLQRAWRLLRDGRPVREVGMQVGIADQNYFARWFKKHTGIQPSRGRGLNQKS